MGSSMIKRLSLAMVYVGVAAMDFNRHRITGWLMYRMVEVCDSPDKAFNTLRESDGHNNASTACRIALSRKMIAETRDLIDKTTALRERLLFPMKGG